MPTDPDLDVDLLAAFAPQLLRHTSALIKPGIFLVQREPHSWQPHSPMENPQHSCLSLKLLHDAISALAQNASQASYSQSMAAPRTVQLIMRRLPIWPLESRGC